ncbi:hypothetical protein CMI37_32330 [Candidatus Pacearchaeota archaeon]|nr:hypothetical protein [Candidatus Pacearchaeota archaeon]|tara:strand:+ start:139 stop:1095 length:957 start_codon:yes stop_codon:yes gene_type:complete
MSEVQTSPESTPEVSTPAPTSVESSQPSGSVTETAPAGNEAVASVPASEVMDTSVQTPQDNGLGDFDPSAWDGNLDLLPPILKEPVSFLHRQLESGYTKKFQDLSDQRKTFETERDEWTSTKEANDLRYGSIEEERNLLQELLQGAEDPRIAELTTANEAYEGKFTTLQSEYDRYRQMVEKDIEAQADQYAERFKTENAEIFDSDEKRAELMGLLDADWDPEIAVKLVGRDESFVNLAKELREKGVPPQVAIEHAMLKLGKNNGPRVPRPGAQITSGAAERNNPASVPSAQTRYANSNRQARTSAAQEALLWAKQQRS